jgi:predicted sulfurtransferase
MERHGLAGKARIASEGFNITLGGTREGIAAYISACLTHWSFSGLLLSTPQVQDQFFKPSAGCACVFGPDRPISVRVTAEITPMGVTGYIPNDWTSVEALSPQEFHRRCYEEGADERILLVDVRNHYESRIGYFISPRNGEPALRPPIRRFSQWPLYVKRRLRKELEAGEKIDEIEDGEKSMARRGGDTTNRNRRQIMTYCTGGIRCEKGVRWMQEQVDLREGERVCTLHGGIAAYLAWMEEEVKVGRKRPEESLFRGRNYVFDARGSTGLSSAVMAEPVSACHICHEPSDSLSKCRSKGCHLVLVVCDDCNTGRDPRCCTDCRNMDEAGMASGENECMLGPQPHPRPMCSCERERETQLWGGERARGLDTQG